ncbi:MAG: ADP-forming succinate--CoA ligase subunit beta [Candidatus Wallbacteria bacterium]|nr:ADP-forming succinate--CoA ligase subunit beta [Candidatus Wallbacteria bacterium]
MKIHEYQAKEILRKYGLPVPRGAIARTPADAAKVAQELGAPKVVVKAQIHAGGRGKGGGIKLASSPAEAGELAEKMLGMTLVTPQTGPSGRKVHTLLIEEGLEIARELYLAVVLDRARERLVLMASPAGGMDIEEVAAHTPEKIFREHIAPDVGLCDFQARSLAYRLELPPEAVRSFCSVVSALVRVFIGEDASLAEINPLVLTRQNTVLPLDCKLNLDDNGLYRHRDNAAYRDLAEEDALEVQASEHSLNYIRLDGNVGCMVNGAGLAMATMDLIKLAGGEPANFLDVGGGASAKSVENAFRIIRSDPKVKAILINIFGGIVRCDRVASGVIEAARKIELDIPVVVRLEGTNAEEAEKLLAGSGLKIEQAKGLADAARKAVAAATATPSNK